MLDGCVFVCVHSLSAVSLVKIIYTEMSRMLQHNALSIMKCGMVHDKMNNRFTIKKHLFFCIPLRALFSICQNYNKKHFFCM